MTQCRPQQISGKSQWAVMSMRHFCFLIFWSDLRRLLRWAAASNRVWYTSELRLSLFLSRAQLSGVRALHKDSRCANSPGHSGTLARCSPSAFFSFLTTVCALGCDSERLQRERKVSVCSAGQPPLRSLPRTWLRLLSAWPLSASQTSVHQFPLRAAGTRWSAGTRLIAEVLKSQSFQSACRGTVWAGPKCRKLFLLWARLYCEQKQSGQLKPELLSSTAFFTV